MQLHITPQFNTKEIIDSTIKTRWFEFQMEVVEIGKRLHSYMVNYVNQNRKRSGGTGKLAGSIQFDWVVGPGTISWGIGLISTLPQYWYVVNYGKKITGEPFIPGGGKYRPYLFTDGKADAQKRGKGTSQALGFRKRIGPLEPVPSVIRPMNYIESTSGRLDAELATLFARLRSV